MVDHRHRELHEYLQDRVGEHYRTAVCYDAEIWQALHGREDLSSEALNRVVPTVVDGAVARDLTRFTEVCESILRSSVDERSRAAATPD